MSSSRNLTTCHPLRYICIPSAAFRDLSHRKQILAEPFDTTPFDDGLQPCYNTVPTEPVPVIRRHPEEPRGVTSPIHRGLVPSRAKNTSGSASRIQSFFVGNDKIAFSFAFR
jgi:putative SOS response-associated peptidase YedK